MQSKAHLVRYLVSGAPGVLALDNGRLTFMTDDQEQLLDAPVQDVSHVRPSWIGYGSILTFRAGGKKYGFRMTDMAAAGPVPIHSNPMMQGVQQTVRETSAIARARALVNQWCDALKAAGNTVRP